MQTRSIPLPCHPLQHVLCVTSNLRVNSTVLTWPGGQVVVVVVVVVVFVYLFAWVHSRGDFDLLCKASLCAVNIFTGNCGSDATGGGGGNDEFV